MGNTLGDRLRALREQSGKTQRELAALLCINRVSYTQYENNKRTPPPDTLRKLAIIFNVSVDYLLGNDVMKANAAKKGVKIPVLGRVVAGVPIDAVQEILDYEEITPEMAATGNYFALQVKGSSMEPTLRDGDIVIVKKQSTVDSGDIAIVLVNGNDATVKEIKESPAGITLIGHNAAIYTPQFYSNKEIQNLPIQIIGKVVEMRRKF